MDKHFSKGVRRILATAMALGLCRVAAADSGIGVDLSFGNKLDPTGWKSLYDCSPDGLSWLTPTPHRSPTGFLYPCPPDLPEQKKLGDWLYSDSVSLGYIWTGGSERENTLWQRYSDWERGFLLGLSQLSLERPEDGLYIDLRGSHISDDNQYYKAIIGRAGSYRVEAFYRDLPNIISADARSIWNGLGTNQLTLKDGLTPGGSTSAQVAAVSAAAPVQRLQFTREREGLGLNYYFNQYWSALVNLTNEDRKGDRPYGGPFFFNYPFPANGGILEVPRPIHDSTVNVSGALRGTISQWRTEFVYTGSFFRQKYLGWDYQTPFPLYPVVPGATSAALTTGEFSSEPDNDYHYLRVSLGRQIPLNGDLAIVASAGRMRQNDDLLPPISCQGQFGIDLSPLGSPVNPYLYNCADWNTTAALSRKTADLTIDTSSLFVRFLLQPWQKVSVRADAKYRNENYKGLYLLRNPITGQYGYVSENGSQGSVVPGESGIWDISDPSAETRYQNIPLDKTIWEAHLGTDWRATNYDTVGLTYGLTRTDRSHREVYATDDHEIRLTWVNRRFEWVTLRANYSFIDQNGDDYVTDPYNFAYQFSIPGFVYDPAVDLAHTVDAMRKYDVSNRREHKVDVMATFIPAEDMTISLSARADLNQYSAIIGRQKYSQFQTTAQWEWQPTPATNASVYYSFDQSHLKLANVNDAGTNLSDEKLGGVTYLDSARWWATDHQRNHNVGLSLDERIWRVHVSAAYNYLYSRGVTGYTYASANVFAFPDIAPVAGNEFPAMTYQLHSVNIGLKIPVANHVAVRLFDYYELGRIFDWHYAGFDQSLVYDHRVYTDQGPRNYSDNVAGLMLDVQL
jgi:hypothetical protein